MDVQNPKMHNSEKNNNNKNNKTIKKERRKRTIKTSSSNARELPLVEKNEPSISEISMCFGTQMRDVELKASIFANEPEQLAVLFFVFDLCYW